MEKIRSSQLHTVISIVTLTKNSITGTRFPTKLTGAATVQYNGTFLVAGGYLGASIWSKDIYMFEYTTESWARFPGQLRTGREHFAAMLIDRRRPYTKIKPNINASLCIFYSRTLD